MQIGDFADRRPVIGMLGRKQRGQHRHRRQTVGPVLVVLTPLVEHDVPLVRELRVGQRRQQVAHAIGFHPQRELERVRRHDLPVVRAVGVGRSVQRAARALQRREVARVVMLRSFEHQVLEEMREPGAPGLLVLRPDVIPDVDGDDRAGAVLVQQHVEAVRQRVLDERNVHRTTVSGIVGRAVARDRHLRRGPLGRRHERSRGRRRRAR